jgi:hypothetical protein
MSRDLLFLDDFAEFYVAGFRFSETFFQYWDLKPSEITLVFGLKRGTEILNTVSQYLSFLHDFAEFYVAGFRFSDTFFAILGAKAFRNHFSIWLLKGSEILNPVSPDLSYLRGFAEFYAAWFRFSATFLQYSGIKPSEITFISILASKGVRNSEPCVSRFIIFCMILRNFMLQGSDFLTPFYNIGS